MGQFWPDLTWIYLPFLTTTTGATSYHGESGSRRAAGCSSITWMTTVQLTGRPVTRPPYHHCPHRIWLTVRYQLTPPPPERWGPCRLIMRIVTPRFQSISPSL